VRRRTASQDNSPGHDSFLDIVANIVGILIILVMVVGVRVRNAPVQAASRADDLQPLVTALERDRATQQNLYNDVLRTAEQIKAVQSEAAIRHQERIRLGVAVAAMEHEIQSRRSELDAGAQEDFELLRQLSEARVELGKLQQQRQYALASKAEPTIVRSYPTPLSTPVDADEAHFQLRGGRIAFIPLDELIAQFKHDARRQAHKLFDVPELTDTIGPIGGFRFRYTLQRQDLAIDTQMATGQTAYARLKRWTLIPVASELGERLDDALAEGSQFRRVVAGLEPGKTTITIWTYPDSFAEFRRVKEALYRSGFATAGRPLPEGMPIAGSPDGTKSAAQ
jgi:hypothetical protein